MTDFRENEKKWQKRWSEQEIYKTKEGWDKPKFYALDMFPYPSGAWLHVWHPKWYIATDVISRKKILQWYNVLHPMWWDAFGLPAENYAIKNKVHPKIATDKNIQRYKEQIEDIWFTYDWDREISTTDPKFYKWTQLAFIQMYKHYFDEKEQKALPVEVLQHKIESGDIDRWDMDLDKFIDSKRLAYVDYKPINWCPQCKTWLANEDLENWRCERCDSEIERKPMRQWVIRITDYAERMLSSIDGLTEWEDSIKQMQRNWIGKSVWTEFSMALSLWWSMNNWILGLKLDVYTTRIDTVFGMTFVAIAPEHSIINQLKIMNWSWTVSISNFDQIDNYIKEASKKSDLQRTELEKDKTWVRIEWIMAINPFNNKSVPVFVADYVLVEYGTWVVMAVPAHDERDFAFAKKYWLDIVQSIDIWSHKIPNWKEIWWIYDYNNLDKLPSIATQYGICFNSWQFTGMSSDQAKQQMTQFAEQNWFWKQKVNYRIQNWVFSRQRYRWEPIPMIHCDKCGVQSMIEQDLPLELPELENYEPTGTEQWPLANISEFINVKCPKCWQDAKRETNTMPQWAWSSWYWIRYMDPANNNQLVNPDIERYWWQVDVYVWWAEHATRHLIYARFWHKFLHDIGLVSTDEPFKKLQHVWLILAEDGRKMSKRWWNVINPDDVISEYWTDALRVYEMFMWPFDQEVSWSTNWVKWVRKFLDRVERLVDNIWKDSDKLLTVLHKTIKKVTQDIDEFKFNTAVSQMMIFVNEATVNWQISRNTLESFLIILAPFAPHLAEELRFRLGNEFSIFTNWVWPKYDESLVIDETVNIAVQFNGKLRWAMLVDKNIQEVEMLEIVKNDEKLSKYIDWEIKKVIFVPWRIINIIC